VGVAAQRVHVSSQLITRGSLSDTLGTDGKECAKLASGPILAIMRLQANATHIPSWPPWDVLACGDVLARGERLIAIDVVVAGRGSR
jgi:hypothetical protein